MAFGKGDFVLLGDRLCVVVGTDEDPDVPEEHLAVWFGPDTAEGTVPEVWTVPAAYFRKSGPPSVRH